MKYSLLVTLLICGTGWATPDFSSGIIESELVLSVKRGDQERSYREQVTFKRSRGKDYYLQIKTGGTQAIEMIAKRGQFFVKNRNGNWRPDHRKEEQIRGIVDDAVGVWDFVQALFGGQFSLLNGRPGTLANHSVMVYDPSLPKGAKQAKPGMFKGQIQIDPRSKLPALIDFEGQIQIDQGKGPMELKVKFDSQLKQIDEAIQIQAPQDVVVDFNVEKPLVNVRQLLVEKGLIE